MCASLAGFYCLYGQLLREDVLKCAYEAVRANQGAPGVDGVSFWRIEHDAEEVECFLGNILRELKDKTYRASPVKRGLQGSELIDIVSLM